MNLLIDLDDVDSNPSKKEEKKKPDALPEESKEPAKTDEDSDKMIINVKYKNEDHFVSWYHGTSDSDVLDAIVGACDCIMNSGFELIDESGKPVNLKKLSSLPNGSVLTIFEAEEKKEYENILGDKWRIVKVEVPALKHPEAHEAIVVMQLGANLLKCTKNNNPHIRLFQLSTDLKRLLWYSSHKPIDQAYIDMTQILNIEVGKLPDDTIKPLEALEHIAFGINYMVKGKTQSVHLVCKDEKEFDIWMTGIKALMYHFKDVKIPKLELLNHSRMFNKYIALKKIPESIRAYWNPNTEGTIKGIDDIVNKKLISKEEISVKIKSIETKLEKAETSLENVTELGPSHNYYKTVNIDENYADDTTQMKAKAMELMDRCKIEYEEQRKAYETITEKTQDEQVVLLSSIAKSLWRVEIDIENCLDICKQIKEKNKPTLKEKLKSLLPKIF